MLTGDLADNNLMPTAPCGFSRWIDRNKLFAVGLILAGYFLLRGLRGAK